MGCIISRSKSETYHMFLLILCMNEILHRLETMGNHCLLLFAEESSFQGFLGAGFRPSTVGKVGMNPVGPLK